MMRVSVRDAVRWRSAALAVGLAVTALLAPVAAGTAAAAPADFRLEAGEVLRPGDSLRSPDGTYVLTQQSDGNLVLTGPSKKAVFNTITAGNPGATTVMQPDGNLVVKSKEGRALFHTNTHENPGSFLQVQPDGNLVIYSEDEEALWSRHAWYGTLPSKFVLAPNDYVKARNGACKLVMQGDGNLVLLGGDGKSLFDTKTAGNPGATAAMQGDGNFVVKSKDGRALFDTKTAGNAGARLDVQEDCNVVVRMKDNSKALWNSRTAQS